LSGLGLFSGYMTSKFFDVPLNGIICFCYGRYAFVYLFHFLANLSFPISS
jgi:hypothetical protein